MWDEFGVMGYWHWDGVSINISSAFRREFLAEIFRN